MPDPAPLKSVHVEKMDPRSLVLLERNAHSMSAEKYQRLVANVKRDGCLTSVPLAVRLPDGRYEVKSGNHRTRASIDAELAEIHVMCVDDPLEADRMLAMQLSHNALVGEDDPAILKELYEEIEDIDWREAAGIDDKTLDLLDHVQPVSLNEASLQFTAITVVFLPHELPEVQAAFDAAREMIDSNGQQWLASMADYDALMNALTVVGGAHNVKNQALALKLLVALASQHFADLVPGWWDDALDAPIHRQHWVPLAAVFGVGEIPAEAAGIVRKAIEKMKSDGDVTAKNQWQALEMWAADYLAGA